MRKNRVLIALVSGTFALAGNTAAACSGLSAAAIYFEMDTGFHWEVLGEIMEAENPIGFFPKTLGPMCSFVLAGQFDDVTGTPVAPAGEKFLVQTIFRRDACSPSSDLIVVDCDAVEALLIHGSGPYLDGDVQIAGYSPSLIGHHLIPEGQLDVAGAGSIMELKRQAMSAELRTEYQQGAGEFTSFFLEPDAIDPFCGCQIHYPNSAGALQ